MTRSGSKRAGNLKIKPRPSVVGTTLVELMVAVALIGVISIGVVGVFASISKSIQFSKTRSLATNLAQEQMQIMKQKTFNKVLVTTAPAYITDFSPNIPYDPGYYPPESILEGGVSYTRYTYVQVAQENSGSLTYLGAVADTGMKSIVVTITWMQGSEKKKLQVQNILTNINTTTSNSYFNGKVSYATNPAVGIPGALVTVAENVGWQDFTDGAGNYQINLNPGSYRVIASARGFFTQYVTASVAALTSATQNFQLVAMGSGTVQGSVWINSHPVISQVVGSTMSPSGFCTEFVELYNPSTSTWAIASGASTPIIDLVVQKYADPFPTAISMNYSNLTVAPRSYYIFANTTTVTMNGVTVNADAVYQPTNAGYPDLIPSTLGASGCGSSADADSVAIRFNGSSDWIDQVGWTLNLGAHVPHLVEGTGLMQVGTLDDGEQYVRKVSTAGVFVGPGRAYDSGNNNNDFVSALPAIYPIRSASNNDIPVSGTPAIGAVVTSADGLSQSATAVSVGNPPVAFFQLTSVATGTWSVFVTSGSYEMEFASVTVTPSAVTYLPNATSVPSWPAAGFNVVMLTSAASQGVVSGFVKDALGNAIGTPSSGIPVTAGGSSANASTSNGYYFLRLAPGTYDVYANAGNVSSSYVSQTSATVVVSAGMINSNLNFTLSQGGRITGYVTRDGINPLSSVAVIANDANDVSRDQEVTGTNGTFTLINLATGTYTVEAVLGSGESSTPATSAVTVTAGATVSAGTFTVTGVFGTVRGSVTSGGAPIRTGVLIICSTASIASTPPALSSTTLTGAGYYLTNSYEDGTYSLDVAGSTTTTYRLYAYYTTFGGSVSSTTVRTASSISITAGNTTSGVNFSW